MGLLGKPTIFGNILLFLNLKPGKPEAEAWFQFNIHGRL